MFNRVIRVLVWSGLVLGCSGTGPGESDLRGLDILATDVGTAGDLGDCGGDVTCSDLSDLTGTMDSSVTDHGIGDAADEVDLLVPSDPYSGMEPHGPSIGEFLGIASHLPKDLGPSFERDFELDRLQEAGFSRFRKTFRWEHMEPENGQYYYDEYDLVIDECLAHGLDVMIGFRGKPGWATPDDTHDSLNVDEWSQFLSDYALHVGDRVDLYEIWNEPNLNVFWSEEPNPRKYGELLIAAHEAIHKSDPDAVVLLGGLSPFQFNELGVWGFLEQVYDEWPEICAYMDAIAIHPYTMVQMLPPEQGGELMGVYQPGLVGMIEEVRAQLTLMGCGELPIHLTELGWPDFYLGVETQAAFTARSIPLALSAGAASWYLYTFWDGEITAETDIPSEERFGLYTWPNDETTQAKPIYEVVKAIGTQLADYRFAGDLSAATGLPPSVHSLVLADGQGRWAVAFWHETKEGALLQPLSTWLPLPQNATGEWTVSDQRLKQLEGSSGIGPAADGKVKVSATGEVQWLRFSTSDAVGR